ncbi:hypothetical protein LPJ61_003683 [Coemansia biformis]|uniref:USP8 dimerisation domain-containing protein n=1 Tax=Coemansia biformis TaxID=1286918 RepID=A0A9W8CXG5_9FUNG|nr:hypothetical protein LPJ61_003683 [Coemansia biformis]
MITLESYAELDESLQCSHTMWVAFAERCIDRARTSKANGNLEDALVKYMMACNVFSRKFQELRDRNAIDNHPEYMRLRDDIDSIVVAELEVLQKSLQGLARSERRRSYAAASRRLSQLRLMEEVLAAGETAILVQDDTEGAIALPPSRPDSMSPMPRPLVEAIRATRELTISI